MFLFNKFMNKNLYNIKCFYEKLSKFFEIVNISLCVFIFSVKVCCFIKFVCLFVSGYLLLGNIVFILR